MRLQFLNLFRSHMLAGFHAADQPWNTGINLTVKYMLPTFVILDNANLFQNIQVLADRGKIDSDAIDKVTDTMLFSIRQLLHDPQPRRMSKRFEHISYLYQFFFIVSLHSYFLCYFII